MSRPPASIALAAAVSLIGPVPRAAARRSGEPVYRSIPVSATLKVAFERQSFRLDAASGNYLSPKVFAKTRREPLVPVALGGKLLTDLKGQPVFLRESIRTKLIAADEAMFKKKHEHLVVTYGFRSNAVQEDLFRRLNGKGKVAPPGQSFHETGMALDLANWRQAQKFMIEAGFVGGCYGIEEDLVHYSIDEITKASNAAAFKRCTLKEIPEHVLTGLKKIGRGTAGLLRR